LDETNNQAPQYHTTNNIPLPDNQYFRDYFNLGNEPSKEIEKINENIKPNTRQKLIFPKINTERRTEVIEPEIKDVTGYDTSGTARGKMFNELQELGLPIEKQNFLLKLADIESDFNSSVVNQFGYTGYYQFGNAALRDVGFNKEDFKDPMNQHKAALKLRDQYLIP
jgi:hypothetical protein